MLLVEDCPEDKRPMVAVLGSGYVGLVTAVSFAEAGFRVVAVDIEPNIVDSIRKGISPMHEPKLNELLSRNVRAGRLRATLNSREAIEEADIVIICVETPIKRRRVADLSSLMRALESVGESMKTGTIVIVSSTLPPKTMLKIVKPNLESLSGLKAEREFLLAYAPERIAPGTAIREFSENPRLVGGIGSRSTRAVARVFRSVCNEVIETDATTAEVVKVVENTFRDVNIAFANEVALLCENFGVDVVDVVNLSGSHPRVNLHIPGPGVGGPCLTKDPFFLIQSSEGAAYDLIRSARRINTHMPYHLLTLVFRGFKSARKRIAKSKVAVLGTAYKGNVSDSRFSPSEPIIRELLRLRARVVAYDPYCDESFGALRANSFEHAVKDADCIVIVADHKEFRDMDLHRVRAMMRKRPVIADGRRIISAAKARELGFRYYAIGFGERKSV
jgi:UDP-N-acetyl-D-mannosaminuronic acid dehydrogenase